MKPIEFAVHMQENLDNYDSEEEWHTWDPYICYLDKTLSEHLDEVYRACCHKDHDSVLKHAVEIALLAMKFVELHGPKESK